jgi:hypothetical protein
MVKSLSILFIAFVFTFSTAPTFAQLDTATLESDISIGTIPLNPRAGESVTLELKSYSSDLTQASIVWRYNGTIIASGIGRTRVGTTAPKSGVATISASVSGSTVTPSTTAISLRGGGVDLLWEAADSYTPPFYKGKALLAPNGWVRATAIPTATAPKNLSYEWSRNDSAIENASGYNKNSLVFKNETLKPQEAISVSVGNSTFTAQKNITLTPQNPGIIAYQTKEGFIDYGHGFTTSLTTTASGIVLRFEPYFFSVPTSTTSDLSFEIQNGDTALTGDTAPNEISLSAPDEKGESDILVTVRTTLYSLQNTTTRFKVLFN